MVQLSVIIPSYNAERTLRACLQAVHSSSFREYELIVINDGSSDRTAAIAKEYTDTVLTFPELKGRAEARRSGWAAAKGAVIVNIDSDVVIKPDTLSIIDGHFQQHPDVDAVTGMLSKECPYTNFASQYKNLYMHYIFSRLPERISFLYGSIFALRKNISGDFKSTVWIADDTALGQHLARERKKIVFLRNCEVVHLKEFTVGSLIRNDYRIPFDWAILFLANHGWKQLFRNRTGFAHSPKEQLISVMLAPAILLLSLVGALTHSALSFLMLPLVVIWFLLNLDFLAFLARERGLVFGARSLLFTFLDHLVMASGIMCGFMGFLRGKLPVPYQAR